MKVFEVVRAWLYISCDTSYESIVIHFKYFDGYYNISYRGPLYLGNKYKPSIFWVQHAILSHAVLAWTPRIRRDIWVKFPIKPIGEVIFRVNFHKVVTLLHKFLTSSSDYEHLFLFTLFFCFLMQWVWWSCLLHQHKMRWRK